MKKNIYLLLLIIIVVLLRISNNTVSQDLYKINSEFYLKKVDYFSEHEITKKNNDNYQVIISDVTKLYEFSKGCIVEYNYNSQKKYLYISSKTGKLKNYDNFESLGRDIEVGKVKWKKPWQFVELKTLNNPSKLINQILLITIIVLVTYLIMRSMDFKKIAKSP